MLIENHVFNIQVRVGRCMDRWYRKNICEHAVSSLCDLNVTVKEMMKKKKINWIRVRLEINRNCFPGSKTK